MSATRLPKCGFRGAPCLVGCCAGDVGLTWLANIFGGRSAALARRAQRAETHGDLPLAAELYAEAERSEDAARVMMLRGDGEAEARARLPHYVQAISTAPEDSPTRRAAREKRALLMIALAGDGALSAAARHDVLEAAHELEDVDKPTEAAAAFARAGNVEGQARALAAAGSVDDLEDLLSEDANRQRRERAHHQAQAEIDLRIACGRRREALELAESRPGRAPPTTSRCASGSRCSARGARSDRRWRCGCIPRKACAGSAWRSARRSSSGGPREPASRWPCLRTR